MNNKIKNDPRGISLDRKCADWFKKPIGILVDTVAVTPGTHTNIMVGGVAKPVDHVGFK